MDASSELISIWSYGLAGCVYALFAIYLASNWRTSLPNRSLLVAIALSAVWGISGLAFALTEERIFLAGSLFADLFRHGSWYFFLLVLLRPDAKDSGPLPPRLQWLIGIAAANQATKKAAATANGLTGLFGYASTLVSGVGLGFVAQHYGWNWAYVGILGMAVVGMLVFLLMWGAKADGYEPEAE